MVFFSTCCFEVAKSPSKQTPSTTETSSSGALYVGAERERVARVRLRDELRVRGAGLGGGRSKKKTGKTWGV